MMFRVWCLSWEEDEDAGMDVAGYDATAESKRTDHQTIWVPDWWKLDAKKAAELYADYVHAQRDGWESSWPLTFRVKPPGGDTTEDYEVERETVPQFTARPVSPTKKG